MRLRWVILSVVALGLVAPASISVPSSPPGRPEVVIAHIDTGINPYNVAFRDDSPRAEKHPCTYLPGYPCDAEALRLHLDAPDYATALALDAVVWGDADTPSSIVPGRLYWIPGTKIVGAVCWQFAFAPGSCFGGVSCPFTDVPLANAANDPSRGCIEHPILDDHGHGTMTASRMASSTHSLCPQCLVVSIEGLSGDAVRWVADQGWIDVQTNSWVDLVPPPANHLLQPVWDADASIRDNVNGGNSTTVNARYAAERMPTLFASGNGAAYLAGFAPTPTYLLSTAPPGVILVGGHDNGRVTAWAGAPPHVAADAYGGWLAVRDGIEESRPDPLSCCTSSSSPYAAGGAAAILLEARRILKSPGTGAHDGALAAAPHEGRVPATGPLADGVFTLDEFRAVYFRTAESRPQEGKDDGLLHWTGTGGAPPTETVAQYGPGANPFCHGCWTLPVRWTEVPSAVDQYPTIGYGAVNEFTVAKAARVLAGLEPAPARPLEDAQYAADQAAREVEFAGS